MNKFRVFISGQKFFAEAVFDICRKLDIVVVGVCCPVDDKYIGTAARRFNIPIIPSGNLNADNMPECDLGITAHSFDYIGKRTRYIPRLGWLGYHPSLLPRHRGRSSIEWAIRMKEPITGGTVFWLNAGIDRGDIAYQDWCWIPPQYHLEPQKSAAKLWRDELCPMGLNLFERALKDLLNNVIIRTPQDSRYSTFEPDTNVKDIYKPDLLMIDYKEKAAV
ncbi:methionyl-tRNA formyltransferase [Chryseobacterium sp. H3056]|uniref:Methionyl-tRNA formyltransferase n=1 Tax=Kaistella daneshvariae TaxID=2487074 RepID=A0A3N0WXN9_9FLAO|nr:formyltransferase family protein [Kaistella daneshvariae]ROI09812.1 methionyl-tRNA formyltransferase [Kaistella daneshvariae]